MANAVVDLAKSEKGICFLSLVVVGVVLGALGKATWEVVLSFLQVCFGIYVTGKTLQGLSTAKGVLGAVAGTIIKSAGEESPKEKK